MENLTVTGKRERSEDKDKNDNRLHRSERFYGEYRRSITLPDNVKADQIEAHYEHGVLSVTVPKAQLAESRRIEIGTSPKQKTGISSAENNTMHAQAKEMPENAQAVSH
ncbi:MAG: Hsp20/alpha crystallin family protein [Chitinophagaceae bacterium]|nr:Hsp20/alpha crystallin family protein [Oligoflexus sp.]